MAKINPSDITVAKGSLYPAMFRGYTPVQFTDSLNAFVLEAGRKTRAAASDYDTATGDRLEVLREAEKAYSYHLAFQRLAELHANLASTASEVNISASYTNNARENRILAAQYLVNWGVLLIVPIVLTRARASSSIPLVAEF